MEIAAMAACAAFISSILAPPSSVGPATSSALLFPTSVPSLRTYPRLLLSFRHPAAAAAADPQGAAVLEDEKEVQEVAPRQLLSFSLILSTRLEQVGSKQARHGAGVCPGRVLGGAGREQAGRHGARVWHGQDARHKVVVFTM